MREGARSGVRRWPLSGLRRAELRPVRQGGLTLGVGLVLAFASGRTVISSLSYAGLGPPEDQRPAFARFCRGLLAQAASAAPAARFVMAPPAWTRGLLAALGLLGCGALVLMLSALAAGEPGLGLDLGARLLFATLLLACALPFAMDERRRSFDPRAAPSGLLPPD